MHKSQQRSRKIIRTSVIGIVVNIILVLFKMAVGLITNSIAILLDAVNNLSDALSSIITIIGTKLAEKAPDKKHPYGHGRIEYVTAVLIAVIVLFAGVTSFKESAAKVLHPQAAEYTIVSLVIIGVAVVVKFFCGRYVKGVGEDINSGSLIASGSDAFFDAILSFATLIAAIISMIWGISLEGILGVAISVIIMKAGMEMLLETLNNIIGVRTDHALSRQIKEKIRSYPGVYGAYDLSLHNYGPTQIIGSVHIEVDDDMPAREIHKLSRKIAADILKKFGIILTVGIYAANNCPGEFSEMKRDVGNVIRKYPGILQMHGFYVDAEYKEVLFDLVIDFQADAAAVRDGVRKELTALYPDYLFDINLDIDYSD
ncbi:MAG: cation diffusion facilitator family transporter [Clostridia bacterium]|nr:cation diffusion facilitator family transporter [Clostridia bacterium]